jgi:hypothetical protein
VIFRSAFFASVALLGLSAAAGARPSFAKATRKAGKADVPSDPAHWFATRQGLLRVYQERGADAKAADADAGAPPAAGASCEVVESTPKDGDASARTRESCTMISGRKPKGGAVLTYEMRDAGIYMVESKAEGHDPAKLERLMLPSPARKGKSWSEKRGAVTLVRTVKSAGKSCKTADRKFGDCLVVAVTERQGKRVKRTYRETYAAGVGLVEDAQWELIDVKGL